MSLKQSLLFFVGAMLSLLVLFIMGQNARKSYLTQKSALESFSAQARSLAGLKAKFGSKEHTKKVLDSLNRIAAPARDFKKSELRVLVYENLKISTLDALVRKIQNSTLDIKKLEIVRQDNEKATLRMEVKR